MRLFVGVKLSLGTIIIFLIIDLTRCLISTINLDIESTQVHDYLGFKNLVTSVGRLGKELFTCVDCKWYANMLIPNSFKSFLSAGLTCRK